MPPMINSILRRRLIQTQVYLAICIFAVGLILFSKETSQSAAEGVRLCRDVLLPSLFPFFVISSLAVQTGLAGVIGRACERPMRFLFNVPGACAPAFILGLVGGYPVGAKTAINLFEQKLCTKTEAERLLSFCNNSGPAFILGAVGASIFGGTMAGVLLYGAHVLASVAVGLVFRLYRRRDRPAPSSGRLSVEAVPFRLAFTRAVTSSFSSLLSICAFVIFFSVAIRLLYLLGVIPLAASLIGSLMSPLGLSAAHVEKLLGGLLEVTTGISSLINLSASMSAKLGFAAFMLGWAGLSVHCQVLNFIGESGLSPLPYIGGKALHGVFSAVIAFVGAQLLPFDAAVSRNMAVHMAGLTSVTLPRAFALSLLCALVIWGALGAASIVFLRKKRCHQRRRKV